jgi:hypothetical protein
MTALGTGGEVEAPSGDEPDDSCPVICRVSEHAPAVALP